MSIDFSYEVDQLRAEAHAEITSLREENEKLREALKPFQGNDICEAVAAQNYPDVTPMDVRVTLGDLRKARLALEALELGCQADASVTGEPVSREGALQSGNSGDALTRLNAALSEFCNGATDEYLPSAWAEETKRNFKELCEAYNAAALAGIFKQPVTGQYGETKSDQAYQVIGTLATVGDCFNDPEVQRALDYFAEDTFDPKFLPFKIPQRATCDCHLHERQVCDVCQIRVSPSHVSGLQQAIHLLSNFDIPEDWATSGDFQEGWRNARVAMVSALRTLKAANAQTPIEERSDEASAAGKNDLLQEFAPCALELDDAGITEMVLKDCLMVWEPWGSEGVEIGYDVEGDIQAIHIPALVGRHKLLRRRLPLPQAHSLIEEPHSGDTDGSAGAWWTPQMKSAAIQDAQNVCDLSALVGKFIRRVRKGLPLEELATQADDFMKRKGLYGGPLRERDAHPQGEDPLGASFMSSPVPAGNSPEVSAAGGEAGLTHKSDCAVHNPPALPAGECDCGAEMERLRQENRELRDELRRASHGDACLCPECFIPADESHSDPQEGTVDGRKDIPG